LSSPSTVSSSTDSILRTNSAKQWTPATALARISTWPSYAANLLQIHQVSLRHPVQLASQRPPPHAPPASQQSTREWPRNQTMNHQCSTSLRHPTPTQLNHHSSFRHRLSVCIMRAPGQMGMASTHQLHTHLPHQLHPHLCRRESTSMYRRHLVSRHMRLCLFPGHMLLTGHRVQTKHTESREEVIDRKLMELLDRGKGAVNDKNDFHFFI